MIGEIGGTAEEEAADFIKTRDKASRELHRRCDCSSRGSGWAIWRDHFRGKGTADEKFKALEAAGVKVTRNLAEIGEFIKRSDRLVALNRGNIFSQQKPPEGVSNGFLCLGFDFNPN